MPNYLVTNLKTKVTGESFHSYPSIPNVAILEKPEVIMVLLIQDFLFLLVRSERIPKNCDNSIPIALPRQQPPGSSTITPAHRLSLETPKHSSIRSVVALYIDRRKRTILTAFLTLDFTDEWGQLYTALEIRTGLARNGSGLDKRLGNPLTLAVKRDPWFFFPGRRNVLFLQTPAYKTPPHDSRENNRTRTQFKLFMVSSQN